MSEQVTIEHSNTLAVIRALAFTTSDWRTTDSLAAETKLTWTHTLAILTKLSRQGFVRHPVAARGKEFDYWRLADRRKTWQEWIRLAALALSRGEEGQAR